MGSGKDVKWDGNWKEVGRNPLFLKWVEIRQIDRKWPSQTKESVNRQLTTFSPLTSCFSPEGSNSGNSTAEYFESAAMYAALFFSHQTKLSGACVYEEIGTG